MNDLPTCPGCGREQNADEFLSLWDGRDYCVACLQTASPRLLARAREQGPLQEIFQYSEAKLGGLWFLTWLAAWSGFWLLIPFFGIAFGELTVLESLQAWAIACGLGLPLVFIGAVAYATGYTHGRPLVSCAEGQLTVMQRGKSETVPLSDCEWFAGRICNMNMLAHTVILMEPALIIVLPPAAEDPTAEEKLPRNVAVGMTKETWEIWNAFFRLTKLRQRTVRQGKRQISGPLKLVLSIVALPASFVGFLYVSKLVGLVLRKFIADENLVAVVATNLLMWGSVTSLIYMIYYSNPWYSGRLVPTKRSAEEQIKRRRNVFLGSIAINTTFFAFPILMESEDFTVTTKIVGILFSYVWAILFGYDFGRRLAQYEREGEMPADPNV